MAVLGNWKEEKEAAKKRIVIYLVILALGLAAVLFAEKKFNDNMQNRFSARNAAVERGADE